MAGYLQHKTVDESRAYWTPVKRFEMIKLIVASIPGWADIDRENGDLISLLCTVMSVVEAGSQLSLSATGAVGLMQIIPWGGKVGSWTRSRPNRRTLEQSPPLNLAYGVLYFLERIVEEGSVARGVYAYNQGNAKAAPGRDQFFQSTVKYSSELKRMVPAVNTEGNFHVAKFSRDLKVLRPLAPNANVGPIQQLLDMPYYATAAEAYRQIVPSRLARTPNSWIPRSLKLSPDLTGKAFPVDKSNGELLENAGKAFWLPNSFASLHAAKNWGAVEVSFTTGELDPPRPDQVVRTATVAPPGGEAAQTFALTRTLFTEAAMEAMAARGNPAAVREAAVRAAAGAILTPKRIGAAGAEDIPRDSGFAGLEGWHSRPPTADEGGIFINRRGQVFDWPSEDSAEAFDAMLPYLDPQPSEEERFRLGLAPTQVPPLTAYTEQMVMSYQGGDRSLLGPVGFAHYSPFASAVGRRDLTPPGGLEAVEVAAEEQAAHRASDWFASDRVEWTEIKTWGPYDAYCLYERQITAQAAGVGARPLPAAVPGAIESDRARREWGIDDYLVLGACARLLRREGDVPFLAFFARALWNTAMIQPVTPGGLLGACDLIAHAYRPNVAYKPGWPVGAPWNKYVLTPELRYQILTYTAMHTYALGEAFCQAFLASLSSPSILALVPSLPRIVVDTNGLTARIEARASGIVEPLTPERFAPNSPEAAILWQRITEFSAQTQRPISQFVQRREIVFGYPCPPSTT